jgi:7-cyano-7-deazaguanine synthase
MGYYIQNFHISYGQAAERKEVEAVKTVSAFYDVPLEIVTIKPQSEAFMDGEIIGRNAFLIFSSLMMKRDFQGVIALGIHSGTPYYDCTEQFVNRINGLLEDYSTGTIILDAPFLKWDKKMILLYCRENNVPIYLTYSCERGGEQPCGICLSCRDRMVLNVD